MANLILRPGDHGLLHCCRQMKKKTLRELTKKPLYSAAKTPLAGYLVKDAHLSPRRSTSHTVATVRQSYWIPKLRQQMQADLRNCVHAKGSINSSFTILRWDLYHPSVLLEQALSRILGSTILVRYRRSKEQTMAKFIILTCMTTRLLHVKQLINSFLKCQQKCSSWYCGAFSPAEQYQPRSHLNLDQPH